MFYCNMIIKVANCIIGRHNFKTFAGWFFWKVYTFKYESPIPPQNNNSYIVTSYKILQFWVYISQLRLVFLQFFIFFVCHVIKKITVTSSKFKLIFCNCGFISLNSEFISHYSAFKSCNSEIFSELQEKSLNCEINSQLPFYVFLYLYFVFIL